MADVKYKEYSPEEDRIYTEAITKIREGMKNGLSFDNACDSISVENEELRSFILDDALKIMIAELHYGKSMTLDEVAKILNVPINKVSVASLQMLEDAGIAAAELNRKNNPAPNAPAGNV
ncbi:MAG TPA: hypothetical protein VK452_08540 [Dissulfurispiraceae bacterium]|nr:hypothetical protein [Dissulfurispiraceae bacterium]